jgi:hypothetical protein
MKKEESPILSDKKENLIPINNLIGESLDGISVLLDNKFIAKELIKIDSNYFLNVSNIDSKEDYISAIGYLEKEEKKQK